MTTTKYSLCIVSTFKNEARIVSRLYASLADIADAVYVCDTGSTDGTPEAIKMAVEEHMGPDVPVKVDHKDWKNFGFNRTWTLRSAQAWAKSLIFSDGPRKWVFMVLDGDMTLVYDNPTRSGRRAMIQQNCACFDELQNPDPKNGLKRRFKTEGAALRYRDACNDYVQTFMFPETVKIKYVGVTHESPACAARVYVTPDGIPIGDSTKWTHEWQEEDDDAIANHTHEWLGLGIKDFADGGCKSDKYTRDISLLSASVSREVFYLANSHRCAGQYARALVWYDRRIELGGFEEEVFKSLVFKAECLAFMYEHGRNWSYDADPFNPPSLKKVFELASGTTEQRNDLAKVIGELHTFSSSRKDREKVGQRKYFGLEGEVMHPVPDMEQVIAAYVKAAVYRPKRAFEAYYGLFKFLDGKDPQFTRRRIYVDDAFRCLQLPYPSDEILFTMKSHYDYALAEKIWPTLAHLGRMQDAMSLKAKAEARGKPSKLNANLSEAPTSAFYAEVLKKFRDDGLDLNYAQRKLMIDDATKTLEANWNWNLADELSIVLFYIGRYDEAIKWYTKIKREAEAKTNGVPFEQVKRMNLHIGYALCKRDHPKDCSFKCIKSY